MFWLNKKALCTLVINQDPRYVCANILKEYKPPSSKDIPVDFRVNFVKKNPNPKGVLGAKGKNILDSFDLTLLCFMKNFPSC